MKTLTKIILCAAAMVLATAAAAHEFSAPATVTADGDGHFSYEITIEISTATEFAFVDIDGTDNTDIGHFIGDGFCMVVIEPGIYTETMEGTLLDPYENGSVIYTHAMCDGWTGQGTTIILAPTVANTPVTWSGLKALYR